jgi:feruloyl esterase
LIDQALTATPDSWISPEKLAVVTNAALKACHGENGFLDNPGECRFDPSSLVCRAGESDQCLSPQQIAALTTMNSGLHDASGNSLYPGFPPGGEAGPIGWSLWLTGAEPKRVAGTLIYIFQTHYFSDMVYNNSNWDFRSESAVDDLARAQKETGSAIDASDPDLSAYQAAGGKLLQYHGWTYAAIPTANSILNYEQVAAKMGGLDKIQPFYRLFLAPGMQHCSLGLGPTAVGGTYGLRPPSRDAAHDVVAALAHWVEDGTAPTQITATLYRGDDPSREIVAQRPWCAYPAVARFSGQGSRSEAASFACAAPAK